MPIAGWKKLCLFFYTLVLLPCFAYTESPSLDLGTFNFYLSPKILEEGSITDMGLGYAYTETLSGEIRFRNTKIAKNEELAGTADSLNAVNETIYEFFLFPVEYQFLNKQGFKIAAGAGLYYEYDKLGEKGFFNMPSLETLNPPRERVNSYTNDFTMHLLGPLLEGRIGYSAEWFSVGFSGGVIPVFFLNSTQKTGIVPLLDPHYAEHSQKTWGSPHFYLSLDTTIFKYINLTLLYDYIRLKYQFIDFDENLDWITPDRNTVIQSFRIETSALLPCGGDFNIQAGYGYTFDSTRLDSAAAISGNRQYVILAVKKTGK
ncbi:MAG: hypothetical protein LBH20_09765 [Treponema sp.]|jgi:hypothetical protein|nr:hypothetical protein [Treponema sp.]